MSINLVQLYYQLNERMIEKMKFKNVKFDDYCKEEDSSTGIAWSQICKNCVNKHNINDSCLSDIPHESICGVEGCEEEADYYIDFEE